MLNVCSKQNLQWRCVISDDHFSKHQYPKLYSTYTHWTTRDIFQCPILTTDRMYGTEYEISGPRVHLVLSPITVRQTRLMERLINVLVCYTLSANQNSPTTVYATSSSSFLLHTSNEQSVLVALLHIWDSFTPHSTQSDVITGKSMSPLLFSGAGQGVRTSALIIQLLTLLSESEPERRSGETADSVVYQSFIKPLCSHRRVTSDCGSAGQGVLQLQKPSIYRQSKINMSGF